MKRNEQPSPRVTKLAAQVLRSPGASDIAKSMAGSVVSQTHTKNQTTPATATKAANALDDGRSSKVTRTLAASVLTQAPDKR
jgi:hypothetical protein